MDMTYGSSESFRLYPYQGSDPPRDLRLTYRKIGGMTPYGEASAPGSGVLPWTVKGFGMTFADVADNDYNTAKEIAEHSGGNPVMPAGFSAAGITNHYVKADAFNSFMISADVPSGLVGSGDVAVLPTHVRLRISRRETPIVGRWNEIANADNVLTAFSNICAIWVRSPNAGELDMNLFTTLSNRGYSPEKCVQAFTHNDFLYIDFIALLTDAVSQNVGKTAFCQVVEDDQVPYILIGDGSVDNAWTLGFYIAAAGDAPPPPTTPTPNPGDNTSGDGGGGGCDAGGLGMIVLCLLMLRKTGGR
jgi:hypothetical protein